MEADIKRLARKKNGDNNSDDEHGGAKKSRTGPSALELERAKYLKKGSSAKLASAASASGKGKRKDDGGELWAKLEKFQGKLRDRQPSPGADHAMDDDDEEGEGLDVDNDTDWMSHRLSFPKGNDEEVRRAEHDYDVIDPRTREAAAQQEERDKRRAKKPSVGSAFRRGR